MSSSIWMSSSETSFSTRAISWIWKRIVSRFSNSSVTTGPTWTRRRRLSSITCLRNSSRSRSYARTSAMSARASLRGERVVSMSVLWNAVGAGDERDRMERGAIGLLGDRGVGEVAVAGDDGVAGLFDLLAELARDGDRDLLVLGAQAPHAVDAGALLHDLDLGARELEQVAALEADVLRPQMAGGVIG